METGQKTTYGHTNELTQAGLSTEQALIYQALLENGAEPARRISSQTGIGRSLVYKNIEGLLELGLVEKIEKEGSVTKFVATHPQNIVKQIENRIQKDESAKSAVNHALPLLTSQFNLLSGKPNVIFYEGEKGMAEVLDDSLYAKEEICTFGDMESILKYIPDVNAKYVRQREKLGIKKRALVLDSPANRKALDGYAPEVSNFRYIATDQAPPFTPLMNIYDGKVSYLTLNADRMIGVIIEDPDIYAMQKYIFEFAWEKGRV